MAARLTAYIVACIVAVTFIAGLIVGAQRDDEGPVDLIIINGKVFARDGESGAEAVAIQGNKVLRVGSNREIQRLRRTQTIVVDARGGSVLPGFNDAHVHLVSGGLALDQLNLAEADTLDAVKETIRAWAEANPHREWVRGRGWSYASFGQGLPTRQLLDALVPDRPAYLVAYDGHTGWANSEALRLAGITRRSPDPENGTILKEVRTGEPTGVLKEAAMSLMQQAMPAPTRDDRLSAIRAAMIEAHRVGITSVQNAGGSPEDFELYGELRRRGELTVRVYQALPVGPETTASDLDALDTVRERFADDPVLKTGAVKLMVDGVVETGTAAMLAPYATSPTETGRMRMTPDALARLVVELDRRGWQVMAHAIGDAAIRSTLDAYERAIRSNPEPARGRRHRIEHVETPDPEDLRRFGALGVVASLQPVHGFPPADTDPWALNLGPERAARGWMSNSLLKSKAPLAFGSDWPVASLDPLAGVFVAVNRTSREGDPPGGWQPAERIALRDAVRAYTSGAAWASFDEQRKGRLDRDMLADIVILSVDIFAVPPDELGDAEVVMTIADGRIVYRRDPPETTTEP
jgi:hypothetical protein